MGGGLFRRGLVPKPPSSEGGLFLVTKLKNVSYRGSQEYVEALSEIAQSQGQTLAQFVESAVQARVEAIGASLPASKAPRGVRVDMIPRGWKSRLYRDMHQLVCQWGAKGFVITPFHQFHATIKDAKTYTDVIGGEKVELYVVGIAEMNEALYHDLALSVLSWITEQGL